MDDLLHAAWYRINQDAEIWCAVLSAEGEKGFCIGADVSGGAERKTCMARPVVAAALWQPKAYRVLVDGRFPYSWRP